MNGYGNLEMAVDLRRHRLRRLLTVPVLVLHGDRDEVVPFALGERLYALINTPKRFVRFDGAGHNDLGARSVMAAKEFLANPP